MVPYVDQLWHWFGRGQFALLVLNEQLKLGWNPDTYALGDVWMKARW